ncbi:pyridoxamine 5'-phosphate oxidase family protein [Holdemania massiliensis]|uniref:pyridoxamine 5'-phosphate oxidase family protein n=1 Tax=Holdemania massiliensis TaxID=1468449 RepID=UPI001F0575F2|nr:pyridoxamine 5'-phosphate oxidase family protein [Holdemania massiliensis]MCH1939066.1 pyridoxamine 5'-phosphate oxidase family protein [Holdemania massiliensis]
MNEVVNYLRTCGTFFLATSEEEKPHVRPFGAVCEFEGKLYFVTNNKKKVYQQLKENPSVELCGMSKGTWIRVSGEVKEDDRREARLAMMNENRQALSSMYTVDDHLMTVFYFVQGEATLYSFTEEPKKIQLD